LEAAKLLLRAGADPSVRNRKGLSPWAMAMKYGHEDIASAIRLAGGQEKG
jgi:ankyrin repeat protein